MVSSHLSTCKRHLNLHSAMVLNLPSAANIIKDTWTRQMHTKLTSEWQPQRRLDHPGWPPHRLSESTQRRLNDAN